MKAEKSIGLLLVLGAIGVLIPYTILTIIFEYPDILRQDTGVILTKFHNGGSTLILTWWAFAILGLPLLVAYSKLGKLYEDKLPFVRWVTTIGIISGIAQIIGLLRWVFVVPVLASSYVNATDPATAAAAKIAFQTVHQFGGVLLGEHIGQLFTIIWTVMITYAFYKLKLMPRWVTVLGYGASGIYLLAQTELFNTIMPGMPVIGWAGFIGSTLWLIWLVIIGIKFMKMRS
jgi:hypothetical protein